MKCSAGVNKNKVFEIYVFIFYFCFRLCMRPFSFSNLPFIMPGFSFICLNTLSHKTVLYIFTHKAGCILIKLNVGVNVCSCFIIHTGRHVLLVRGKTVQIIATIAVTLVFNTTTES